MTPTKNSIQGTEMNIQISKDPRARHPIWDNGQFVGFIWINSIYSEINFLYRGAKESELFTDDDGTLAKSYLAWRYEFAKQDSFRPFHQFSKRMFSEDLENFSGVMEWEFSETHAGLSSRDLGFQIIQTEFHSHFSGMIAETKSINDWLLMNEDRLAGFHKQLKTISAEEKIDLCKSFRETITRETKNPLKVDNLR